MCSVEEDIEDMSKYSNRVGNRNASEYRNLQKCKKCDMKSEVLLQKKDPFCRECFFEYCSHKFRSTIGKSKQIKHGDKVLLACSGGRKSTALLHMTKNFATAKQISFKAEIIFIDESLVFPTVEDEQQQIQNIINELNSYGYPVLCSSLEMICKLNSNQIFFWNCDTIDSIKNFPSCSDSQNCIKECMEDMSLSAKLDFIKHIRLLLITEIANHAGFKHVFVGDTSCSLAENLLNNISLGRGSQISSDTNFSDFRYKVPVCRPLREFLNKEIGLYIHFNDCSYFVLPNLSTKTDTKSCIQRLTESFIVNLQKDFPATVFTIFRTGGKLLKQNELPETEICLLCRSKLDNLHPNTCSALEALKLSEQLSQISINDTLVDSVSIENEGGLSDLHNFEDMNFFRFLCYGCSIPFRKNKKSCTFNPVLKTQYVKMTRNEMKEDIKDFLISTE
ncbi:cytoplasmic tRNA 2-thiolation protein 2 [Caerostris extrusa]|uniref:Cytoplasmic tRNA 2-thiolation protein 2 n=1 Tax=Caerostris extrusa TaxID=172846 RepID=A0AAV4U504_CAEEX|nr:cytoplasmic tRNA 2-thiolation protein 2 [Caerostris extrusa]